MRNFCTPLNFMITYDQFAAEVEKEMEKAVREWNDTDLSERSTVIQMWIKDINIDLISEELINKLRNELINDFGWGLGNVLITKQEEDRGDRIYIELRLI